MSKIVHTNEVLNSISSTFSMKTSHTGFKMSCLRSIETIYNRKKFKKMWDCGMIRYWSIVYFLKKISLKISLGKRDY